MVTLDPNLPIWQTIYPLLISSLILLTQHLRKSVKLDTFLDLFKLPFEKFLYIMTWCNTKHDGGWRIIYHRSAPDGRSINDFIDPFTYSLTYCSIDDAYTIINKLGPGALLCKIDLKDTFRLILMQSSGWNLLEIFWKQKFHVDTCLPFGLRSAPYLFNHLSTALHWILEQNYVVDHLLHY